MPDWDVVIIGGGPAGLTAGLYLSRARARTLLIEEESYGGKIKNLECIENYPGFSNGVTGAQLANEMQNQAVKFGLSLDQANVSEIEQYSSSKCIICSDGRSYNCSAVIIAGGSRPKKLGVSGEKEFSQKGVFNCAFCDGGHYIDQVVAVCGGGDAGVTEALYMTKLAAKVILIEAMPALTASAILQERVLSNPKLEVHCGTSIDAIIGNDKVEGITYVEKNSGKKGMLKVNGVLVHIGLDPNTEYLKGVVPLDTKGQIIVNEGMETEIPLILAAGDIRSGSLGQVTSAVGDGTAAALSVIKLLQRRE